MTSSIDKIPNLKKECLPEIDSQSMIPQPNLLEKQLSQDSNKNSILENKLNTKTLLTNTLNLPQANPYVKFFIPQYFPPTPTMIKPTRVLVYPYQRLQNPTPFQIKEHLNNNPTPSLFLKNIRHPPTPLVFIQHPFSNSMYLKINPWLNHSCAHRCSKLKLGANKLLKCDSASSKSNSSPDALVDYPDVKNMTKTKLRKKIKIGKCSQTKGELHSELPCCKSSTKISRKKLAKCEHNRVLHADQEAENGYIRDHDKEIRSC